MANALSISGHLAYAKTAGFMAAFDNAASLTGIDRNLLLAVADRESHIGLDLDSRGLGDNGHGNGLMQVDDRYHYAYTSTHSPFDHRANVLKGAQILKAELNRYGGNRSYALAAYNAGSGNVDRAAVAGLHPDAFTTGNNYSRDVLNRYNIIRSMASPKQRVINKKVVTVPGKPEDSALELVYVAGGSLITTVFALGYISTKN